jgi:hypothetical protein
VTRRCTALQNFAKSRKRWEKDGKDSAEVHKVKGHKSKWGAEVSRQNALGWQLLGFRVD